MQKWDFEIVRWALNDPQLEAKFKAVGDRGWDLAACDIEGTNCFVIFKRPKP